VASPDRAAREVGRLYASVERELLVRMASRLGQGLDREDWAERKRSEINAVRRDADRIIGALNRSSALQDAVTGAGETGSRTAASQLRELGVRATSGRLDVAAIERLADELAGTVRPAHLAISRTIEDTYRRVISSASSSLISGVGNRRDAAQRALWDFADAGIRGFTDRAGRRWDLASYAEMATRSASARAAVEGHRARLQDSGIDLVQVSAEPQSCDLCAPWEGAVLTLDGSGTGGGTVDMEHATRDGETVSVPVDGSLDEARDAGLFHPNCTHATAAHLPGVSRPPQPFPNREQGAADRDRLRALERRTRRWKQREAAALDEAGRERARQGVRDAQGDIRSHVAGTTAKRRREREQITRAR
jgi:hypothetical protein